MSARFFLATEWEADHAVLTDTEAHHLLHVLRVRIGSQLTLFDGSGLEFTATVTRLGRSSVEVQRLTTQAVDRELSRVVVVGIALPKGERQRWLIEKMVELGVARCLPLRTERGVAQPESGTLDKLRRTVIEASKQCGRNRLLEIASPLDLRDFLHAAPPTALRGLAHPARLWRQALSGEASGGTEAAGRIGSQRDWFQSVVDAGADREIWLALGPEGGFADAEVVEAAACGWNAVSLGARIQRIETAALSLAALTAAACTPPEEMS